MIKNKKGFTLVELIAVITVITLLFSLATPKLMENYNDKKNKLYDATIKELERLAGMYLTDNPDIYSDISKNGYVNISVNTLCNEEYLTCPVKNPKDNGNIDGYVNVVYEDNKYVYRFTDNEFINENVLLEVYLNGGILNTTMAGTYKEGAVIDLEIPTRENSVFKGWRVVKGNSTINDNKLTIGSRETIIYAEWEIYSTLTIDLDGGTGNTSYNGKYKVGSTIELEIPTKEGYTFKGWEVKEGNGILSGNRLTIGSEDTRITANWTANTYDVIYNSGNLLYNMYNVNNITSEKMTYSIKDNVITVTANDNDGFGLTNIKAYLEAGKEYIFNAETSGVWGYSEADDNVEALLMLDGKYDLYYAMDSDDMNKNKYHKFIPSETGVYYLRLDVNQNGKTHTFNNLSISTNEKIEKALYGSTITVRTPTREGYTFTGWDISGTGSSMSGTNLTIGSENVTLTANWVKTVTEYAYTGDYQTFTTTESSYYKVELWGASGGNSPSRTGGKGAYSSGKIYMNKGEKLYLYLGGNTTTTTGGYNGGGTGANQYDARGGGGASDIRYFGSYQPSENDLIWNSTIGLNSRIMVSGAGGGADNYSTGSDGGSGGTLVGANGGFYRSSGSNAYTVSKGGAQSAGGASGVGASSNEPGSFGQGGSSTNTHGGGGGSGYYGGGSGSYNNSVVGSGAGGSSFISGYAGVNAITSSSDRTHTNNTLHYSNKYFIDGEMQPGVNTGNGKAKITYLGTNYEKKNNKIDNVRYIKDCINGNTTGTGNAWNELQAIKDGVNIAYGKNITGTGPLHSSSYTYESVLDADITNEIVNAYVSVSGAYCITVDLEQNYNLDEIAVWHHWQDGPRSYYDHSLYVSSDNETWTTLIDNVSGVVETSNGIRVSAYD